MLFRPLTQARLCKYALMFLQCNCVRTPLPTLQCACHRCCLSGLQPQSRHLKHPNYLLVAGKSSSIIDATLNQLHPRVFHACANFFDVLDVVITGFVTSAVAPIPTPPPSAAKATMGTTAPLSCSLGQRSVEPTADTCSRTQLTKSKSTAQNSTSPTMNPKIIAQNTSRK